MKKVVIAASMLIVLTSLLVGKSITIHSQVEGVKVYLNEIYLGETIKNPRQKYYETNTVGFILRNVGMGVHRFRFEYKNFKPEYCEIVTTGSHNDINYSLIFDELRTKKTDHVINGLPKRDNMPPYIRLSSSVSGATARLNGNPVDLDRPLENLSSGVYKVEYNAPDHAPLKSIVKIENGAYAEIRANWWFDWGFIDVVTELPGNIRRTQNEASKLVLRDFIDRGVKVVKLSDRDGSSKHILSQIDNRKQDLLKVFDDYELKSRLIIWFTLCIDNDGKVKASQIMFSHDQPLALADEIQQIVDNWDFDVDSELIVEYLCRLPG